MTRKRSLNPSKWRANTSKRMLDLGQAHLSTRNKEISARVIKAACPDMCRICRKSRLTEDQRQMVFNEFWAIGSHQAQWLYILSHLKMKTPVVKSRVAIKHRQTSRKYFFLLKKKEHIVCKTMFINTLGICDAWIETAIKKAGTAGTVKQDTRGKHTNRPRRKSEQCIKYVMDHIASIPTVPSHYCRRNSVKQYLPNGMNTRLMHEKYLEWCKENNIVGKDLIVSRRFYRFIFNTKFNLGIFKPKKDQCSFCLKFKASTREEKAKLQQKMMLHLNHKEDCKKLKDSDYVDGMDKSKNICVAYFDLQKILPCPKSENSAMFYRNKLSVLNFTVFDQCLKLGYCYIWDEANAKKGSDEISSCIFNFISLKASHNIKEFRFFSDSCSGQNRNRFLFAMYLLASVKFGVKISHRFLEPGHTMMPVDAMHARIENATKRAEIFDIEEWYEQILAAKVNGAKYSIIKVDRSNVFTYKPLVSMQNWEKSSNKKKVAWGKVKEVSVDSEKPSTVFFRYNLREELSSLNVTARGRPVNLKNYLPPLVYTDLLPLKPKKLRDLKHLLHAIPEKYHNFYKKYIDFTEQANAQEPGVEMIEEEDELSELEEGEEIRPESEASNSSGGSSDED